MICIGIRDAGRRPMVTRRGAHRAFGLPSCALRKVMLPLGIAMAGVPATEAIGTGCGDWGNDGASAFWRAASVETIAAGADVDAKDSGSLTPLQHAVTDNRNPDFVAALIREGADVNARSTDGPGGTTLHEAARHSREPSIISMLVAAGADVNAGDGVMARPLHHAATFNGNPDIISALVEAGANVNARMRSRFDRENGLEIGATPLHRAVRYNKETSVVRALLDAGAGPLATDEHGDTPLELVRHAPEEVRGLLEASVGARRRNHSDILPARTRLIIPRWVKARFELEKQNWSTGVQFSVFQVFRFRTIPPG